jgi:hypothetical protein
VKCQLSVLKMFSFKEVDNNGIINYYIRSYTSNSLQGKTKCFDKMINSSTENIKVYLVTNLMT